MALLAACGPELFPLYAKSLLVPGWAGEYTAIERAYVRAHRSEARSRRASAAAVRLKNALRGVSVPNTCEESTEARAPDLVAL